MADLSIEFLGRRFESPFVLASAPPAANDDMLSRAFDAGWAGAVVKTLIKEPVRNLRNRFASLKIGGAMYAFENIELLSELTPDEWYRDIRLLKKRFPGKMVIGSVMGDAKDAGPWVELALGCQDAGADMLELNFSCPHGYPERGKGAAIGQSAEYVSQITGWLKSDMRVTVPIVPKLTAAVADISHIGCAAADAGADGFCAINTFPSIMGFDLKTLRPKPSVRGWSTPGGYSGPGLKPIALRCVSDLVKSPGIPVMGCGGISSGFDAAEFLIAGAPIVQICTAVMISGYDIIGRMKDEIAEFMSWHGFASLKDAVGCASKNVRRYGELDPRYAVKAVIDPERCDRCGSCYVACRDGVYQAIRMEDDAPVVDDGKCSGCSLCAQVCGREAVHLVEI